MQSVSSKALSVALESSVTNEIPHLSVFNILNSRLRNQWAKELVGQVGIDYIKERTSKKIINGQESPNYKAQEIDYIEPSNGLDYTGTLDKIDFKVTGALETEMDFLMHENARYLSKLYPDDFNSLKTLTAAERQSYFNEALHLIHSYFDTEQIEVEDEADTLYFKDKFITGITPIRGLTGTYQQEEFLLQLLNLMGIVTYSGFKTFMDNKQETNFTNPQDSEEVVPTIQYTYTLKELDKISKRFSEDLRAKIDGYTLKNFLPIDVTSENISLKAFLSVGAITFKRFSQKDLQSVLNTFKEGLTNWFTEVIKEGKVSSSAKADALSLTTNAKNFYWGNTTEDTYKILRANESNYTEWVPLVNENFNKDAFVDLENSFCISNLPFSQYTDQYLCEFGLSSYTEYFKEALSSVIKKALDEAYPVSLNLQKLLKSSGLTKSIGLVVKKGGETLAQALLLNSEVQGFIRDFEELTPGAHTTGNFIKNLIYISDLESCTFQVDSADTLTLDFQVYNLHTDYPIDNALVWDWEGSTYEVSQTESGIVICEITEQSNKDIKVLSGLLSEKSILRDISRKLTCHYYSDSKLLTLEKEVSGEETKTATFILWTGSRFNEVHLSQEDNTKIYVGRRVLFEDYFDKDLLGRITQKKTYVSTEDLTSQTEVASEQVAVCLHKDYDFCLLQINIKRLYRFEDILNFNFSWVTKSTWISKDNIYIYSPEPLVSFKELRPEDAIPASLVRDKIFFKATDLQTYHLRTYPAEFLASDNLKIKKDITEFVKETGRLRGLLINSLGEVSPVVVSDAYIQNGDCYLHLSTEDLKSFYLLKDNKGYILLDIDKKLGLSFEEDTDKSRRQIQTRSCYNINDGEFYLYKENFEELKKAHLKYYLENIYAKVVDVYSKQGLLEGFGLNVPTTLTETSYVTICDLQGQALWKQSLKNLLQENKSLYLNSCLRFLRNVPLVPQLLVWNEQYQSLSYTYNSLPPATITFCNLDKVEESYDSLKDVLEAIQDETGKEMSLEDLENLFSTVKMVWGNVVWDANITKTLKTLRTIWGGYLSSFELKRSNDAIPEEEILKFLNNNEVSSVTKSLNTFAYSYNQGSPDVSYNIASEVPVTRSEKTIKVPQLFTSAFESTYDSSNSKFNPIKPPSGKNLRVIETAFLTGNSLNLKTFNLEETSLRLNVKNITFNQKGFESLPFEVSTKWEPILADETLQFKTYNILGDIEYAQAKLLYNRPFLSEEKPKNFFQGLDLPEDSVALEFFLEYCTFIYYNQANLEKALEDNKLYKSGLSLESGVTLINRNNNPELNTQRDLRELLVQIENPVDLSSIDFQDILEFAFETFNKPLQSSKGQLKKVLPALVRITSDYKFEINIYWLERIDGSEKGFNLFTNNFRVDAHPIILKSLLKDYFKPSFKVSSDNYETFVKRFSYFTSVLPNSDFTFNLDTYLEFLDNGVLGKDANIPTTGEFYKLDEESLEAYLKTLNITSYEDSLPYRILQQVQDFTDNETLKRLSLTYKDTDLMIKDNEETFNLIPHYKVFKEYIPTTIEFSTSSPDSDNSDTLRCFLNFDDDLPTDRGYLLLKDIKIPNKRTTFMSKRETQLLDRNFNLDNLKFLSYNVTDSNTYRFLVTEKTNGSLSSVIENITPLDSKENTQEILNEELTLGQYYSGLTPNLGYTFYKRKFMTSFTIGVDGKTLTLTDSNLEEDETFSLEDHISSGDKIKLVLLETLMGQTLYGEATFPEISDARIKGPYKVVAVDTSTDSSGKVLQKVLLSGAGTLVAMEVNTDSKVISLKGTWVYSGEYQAFEAGGYIYAYTGSSVEMLGELKNFLGTGSDLISSITPKDFEAHLPSEIPEFLNMTIKAEGTHTVGTHSEWFGYYTDGDQTKPLISEEEKAEILAYHNSKNLEGTPYFEDIVSLLKPAKVQDTIPYESRDSKIVFDDLDRCLIIPDSVEEVSTWADHPALIMDYKSDTIYQGVVSLIDSITESVAASWVESIFKATFNELGGSSGASEEALQAETEPNYKFTLDEQVKLVELGKLLTGKTSGNFTYEDLYCPEFTEMDVPVLLEDNITKFRKVKVITGITNTKLKDAGSAKLKEILKVIVPVWVLNRKRNSNTSWASSDRYSVAWDQDSSCLTIFNSVGEIIEKKFFNEFGYIRPTLNSAEFSNWVRGNPVTFKRNLTQAQVLELQNSYYPITGVAGGLGLYSFLKELPFTYVQEAYTDITTSEWSQYVDWMASVDFYSDIPLVSFRISDCEYPWKSLYSVLSNIADSTGLNLFYEKELDVLETYLNDIHSDGFMPKGVNYFNFKDFKDSGTPSWVGFSSTNMLEESGIEGTQSFVSLIGESSISIEGTLVRIYGSVDYPELEGFLEKIDSQIASKLLRKVKDFESPEGLLSEVARYKDFVEQSLKESYSKVYQGTEGYSERKVSFLLELDIPKGTYQVKTNYLTDGISIDYGTSTPIIASGGNYYLTPKGYIQKSSTLNDNNNRDTVDLNTKVLSVYEAMKEVSTLKNGSLSIEGSSLRVGLQSVQYETSPEVYGTIVSVKGNIATLKAPAFAVDGLHEITSVGFVSNRDKDNFLGFYGVVKDKTHITEAQTLFEVENESIADFASYNNRYMESIDTDCVFDIYPEWEDLSDPTRPSFYKVSKTEVRESNGDLVTHISPKYLKNKLGRDLLRIVPPVGDYIGGNIIINSNLVKESNKKVSNIYYRDSSNKVQYFQKDGNGEVKVPDYYNYLDLTSSTEIDFDTFVESYKDAYQKIPALVDDPKKALMKCPLNYNTYTVQGGTIYQYPQYVIVEIKSDDPNLKTFLEAQKDSSDKALNLLATLYNQLNYPISSSEAFAKEIQPLKGSGLSIINLDLKAINTTSLYPKLRPITEFKVNIETGKATVDTTLTEIVLPKKGYGQALLGDFVAPNECNFDDGTFYQSANSETVNSKGENFILLDENYEVIKDSNGNPATLPALVYSSFAEADTQLKRDLSTKTSFYLKDALINLANFEIGKKSLSTENYAGLSFLNFQKDLEKEEVFTDEEMVLWVYELFLIGTRISCKAFWGKTAVDPTSKFIEEITDWSTTKREAIPYTRIYLDDISVPINTRYQNTKKEFIFTQTSYTPDFGTLLCDESGNCRYLNAEGKLTTKYSESSSDLIPGISLNSYRKLLKTLSNIFTEGYYQNGTLKSGFDLDALKVTKVNLVSSYSTKSFTLTNEGKITVYWTKNFDEIPFNYNKITKSDWISNSEPINLTFRTKIKSSDLKISYKLSQTKTKYNLIYLRDSNGTLVSKVYFKEPLTEDDLVICSSV